MACAKRAAGYGKKVAVIDYTKKLSLIRATSLPEELAESTGFYKDILMLNGAVTHKKDKASQDVLLHYFGYHLDHAELKRCPAVVFATDMTMYHAALLQNVELAEKAKTYLVIRNYTSLKYNEKYLCQVIGRAFDDEKMLMIPFDETDYRSSCYLCVDKKHRLTSLSGEMKAAVLCIFKDLLAVEYKRKEQAALLKRA